MLVFPLLRVANYGTTLLMATVGALVTLLAAVVCFVAGLVAAKPHVRSTHRIAAVVAPVGACALAATYLVPVPPAAEWVRWATPVGTVLVASAVAVVGVVVAPIGLTGGIASGKSTVSRRLASQHGVAIVDADVVAREVRHVSAWPWRSWHRWRSAWRGVIVCGLPACVRALPRTRGCATPRCCVLVRRTALTPMAVRV